MTLTKAIVALRQHCGLTQQQLAVELGLTVSSISNYEARGRTPDPPVLARLIVMATDRGHTATRDRFLAAFDAALALPKPWRIRLARGPR